MGAASTALKEVTLRIGSDPSLLRIVRLAASSLASDMGFSVHDVEDLTLAVDELATALQEVSERDIEILLRADHIGVTIRGRGQGTGVIELNELAVSVLDQASDLYSVESDGGVPSFSMVKVLPTATA